MECAPFVPQQMLNLDPKPMFAETDRRAAGQPEDRIVGRIVACSGWTARISVDIGVHDIPDEWAVSRFVTIACGQYRIVGLVVSVDVVDGSWNVQTTNRAVLDVELVGEVSDNPAGVPVFRRGITVYPNIGAMAHSIRTADLRAIFHNDRTNTVPVGTLSQNRHVESTISIDEMLSKHFAVVGSTGAGKSSAVSLLLHRAIEKRKNLRVLILDPHNEYAHAFANESVHFNADNLKLPFWLFKLEELAEVIFRGRTRNQDEIDILRDLIATARAQFRLSDSQVGLRRTSAELGNISADTPIPYRIEDLLRLLDERLGGLDNKNERPALKNLRARLRSAISDPSFGFMFAFKRIQDTMGEVMRAIYRVPRGDRPISVIQLSGLPGEVVDSVASVLARLAFDMASLSGGSYEILVLAEEAHRYLPSDPNAGFEPTRLALAKIAKEGRKYGCYLGCVTQRPGELDPTILSQCSTVFAMRLSNQRDQQIIGSAIGDTSASNLHFLPTLGQREAIVFGEGVSTPMRLRFATLPPSQLPQTSRAFGIANGDKLRDTEVSSIIAKMRASIGDGDDDFGVSGIDDLPDAVDPITGRRPLSAQPASAAPSRPATQHTPAPERRDIFRLGRRVTDAGSTIIGGD